MSFGNPKVSVVIASFNHASFVREAIESVLGQSYQDFELVITDDGSSDGTVDVIQSLTDPRIRLNVFKENKGACVAMNEALSRARGHYIAVLNSDDFFLPGKLQKQVVFMQEHSEIGAVFALPRFVDERGNSFTDSRNPFLELFTDQNGSRAEWLRRFFYTGNCLCHPTVMIRKDCYDKIGLFDPLLMQLPDLDLWVRLCRSYDIHVLPEQMIAFRILDGERNTSASSPEKLARCGWEMDTVLGHFVECEEEQLLSVFAGSRYTVAGRNPLIALAMEAIESEKPGYANFGFRLLRDCLKTQPDLMSAREYFRLVGSRDPAAVEFSRYEYKWLKKSRVFSSMRNFKNWLSI